MREKESSCKMVFVRHAEPDFPVERLYCDSHEDPELTERGLEQAEKMAQALVKDEPDASALYVSPLLRARMTAEPVIQRSGLVPKIEPGLKERSFGVWDGLFFNEIEENFPEDYRRWKADMLGFKLDGGESIYELSERLTRTTSVIAENHPGETVIVVSHVGPIRVTVSETFQMPLDQYRQLTVDYASLTRIDFGKKAPNLRYLNRISYA